MEPKKQLIYFAYGSNLHPNRLEARIGKSPQLGIFRLFDYKLNFNKPSIDGSAKCNISKDRTHSVYGVLYNVTPEQKALLDQFEAGYSTTWMNHKNIGQYFTYLANPPLSNSFLPYHWYKILVVLGAGYHNFPARYLNMLGCLNSVRDENVERTENNLKIFI